MHQTLKKLAALAVFATATTLQLTAQPVTDLDGDVGVGTTEPLGSALFDLTSTSKGFLMPRMTTAQRIGIPGPANGLWVYDIDQGVPFVWSDASGVFQWDAVITTGSNLAWLTNGNSGLTDGTNNFLGTTDATPVRLQTNGAERIRIEADGDVGFNQTTPSAKLDVVATAGAPAIEANTTSGVALFAQSNGSLSSPGTNNWGIFASVASGTGNVGVAGIAGSGAPINVNAGVTGANDAGYGVAGNSVASGFAGVFGNATAIANPAIGVLGRSASGNAGRFEITNAANTSNALEISTSGTGDALEVTTTGGGLGIDLNGGALDGNAAGNALGDGTVAQQLTVRGNADAVIGNTLAGNPTAWDLVINGDMVATGLIKVGGSMWLDGVSTPHQLNTNAPLLIATSVGDIEINSAGGTTTVNDDLVVTGSLQLSGPLTLPGFQQGSVLFAGNGGTFSQDNAGFFWDDAANALEITSGGGSGYTPSGSYALFADNGTDNGIVGSTGSATSAGISGHATTGAGIGVRGTSVSGTSGRFENTNTSNTSSTVQVQSNGIGSGLEIDLTNGANGGRGIDVNQAGVGPGVFATSAGGNGVWGITSSISAAGVIGDNTFGEAVVGRNRGGTGVGAVVGRNDSSGYGVRGFNTKNGIGVIGQAGISGGTGVAGRFENINASNTSDVLQVATNGTGVAGRFDNVNASNTNDVLQVTANGIGSGINIDLTNSSNGGRGIDVNQAGVGPGVFATSAGGNGVWGITSSISAAGVIGDNTFGEAVVGRNRGGNGVGAVVGRNDSSGYGIRGFNTKNGIGVIGQAGISGGTGVAGRFENVNASNTSDALQVATNSIGNGINIDLTNSSNGGRGIDVNQAGVGPGVFSTSAGGNGVWGITSSISAAGVIGDNTFGEAVVGRNRGGLGVGAVVGRNDSSGYGVRGFNTKNGVGVIGQAGISGGTGVAGRFENVNASNTSDALQVVTNSAGNAARFTGNVVITGNLNVSGTVAKGGGSFMIDHPLDPENKILYHSFVESPDMKNINDGVVLLDNNGEAWVELPEWFEALNKDFRYQLTAIGASAPGLYIAQEVSGNRFKIAGGKSGMKVSWMVTGIRHDPYAEKHRIQVEVEKTQEQRGTYLHPDAYETVPTTTKEAASGLTGKVSKDLPSGSTVQDASTIRTQVNTKSAK